MYSEDDNEDSALEEQGSDELLAADDLRLPESANILVRVHALRAWLKRRCADAELETGVAALDVQEAMQAFDRAARSRRFQAQDDPGVQHAQRHLAQVQQRLSAYNEAQTLFEDCVAHTTTGERVLVEYYLSLEELVEAGDAPTSSFWLEVMADVQHRVEQVGTPGEGDE
jgi:tetratricopeptide (TPR) repeat protein